MKTGLGSLGGALAVGLALAACDSAPDTGSDAAGQEHAAERGEDATLESGNGAIAQLTYKRAGTAMPNVAFTGPDGEAVQLRDFTGTPVLVNLWATWCAPCKAEMPTLEMLAKTSGVALKVIVVSQDLEGKAAVEPFFREARLTALVPFTDAENALMRATGAEQLPTTILYDSRGREVWRVVGSLEWNDAEVADMLAEAK